MVKKFDVADQLRDFAESIIKQDEAVLAGDIKGVRYYRDRPERVAKRLFEMGDEGIEQFAVLLTHPSHKVRVTAAVYLLGSSRQKEALAALEDIADIYPPARGTIERWEKDPEQWGRLWD